MPAGLYTYAGGHLSLFPNSYHKYPLHEMVFAGASFTLWASLRHFKNDKGETLSERGLSEIRGGLFKKTMLRFLALLATMSVVFLGVFALPNILFIAPHSSEWPKAIQEQSYLTSGICGKGTDRACPGPGVPIARGPQSAYVDRNGEFVVPSDVTLDKTPAGTASELKPFTGGALGGTDGP